MAMISIVTPSYNQARYLRRTIESVLTQKVDLEYLVVDGCSTDGSCTILKEYESAARIIIEKDNGQSDALAKGFSLANGEILGWINSDDLYLPGSLEKVVRAFESGHEFVYGNVLIIDADDRVLRRRVTLKVNFDDLYYGGYVLPQETTFFSRRLYEECGGINVGYNYAMDYDLWIRMARLTTPFRIDEYLSCFRYHDGQKSRQLKMYEQEVDQARRTLPVEQRSAASCFGARAGLAGRTLGVNLTGLGVARTMLDLLNKQLGRLP